MSSRDLWSSQMEGCFAVVVSGMSAVVGDAAVDVVGVAVAAAAEHFVGAA